MFGFLYILKRTIYWWEIGGLYILKNMYNDGSLIVYTV